MKTQNMLFSIAAIIMLLLFSEISQAENTKQKNVSSSDAKIEVIQFHSERRCMTCNMIEELTRETLEDYSSISFTLVNVDEKKNAKKVKQFEAIGTALFLYNPETGKKKELTDFAFMNAGNDKKFITGLKKEINSFSK